MKPISIKGLRAASSIFALLFILNASGCAGAAGSPSVPAAAGTTVAAETTAATESTAATETTAAAETTVAAGTTTAAVPQTSTSTEQTAEAATTKALEKTASEETGAPSSPHSAPTSESDLPTLSVIYQDGTAVAEIPTQSGGYTLTIPQPDGTAQSIIACGADPLSDLAQRTKEIPYVEYGGQMILSFEDGSQPDSVELTDIILQKDGTSQFGERTYVHTTLKCIDGKAEFTLEENPVVYLSSTINPEGFYRGFRVNCTWENGSAAEYGFVFRAGTCFPIESSPETSAVSPTQA
ncbi:hypothetical protein [Enterocloster lavalensis]|uniref:hypothetical protein n=2 Tax=Enterocloster TaxID=2719313 RepID=UPI000D1C18DD|nr:hypothetical protein [Enterocloster lavalensis]PST33521.1 hypothetical protein C7256_09055 [Enterocloster lavalensis]